MDYALFRRCVGARVLTRLRLSALIPNVRFAMSEPPLELCRPRYREQVGIAAPPAPRLEFRNRSQAEDRRVLQVFAT